jgi:tRNA/rRNA methyltransferase
MNIKFVLVEPQTPGNIGAAARAIKTMGFTEMCLVSPCNYLDDEAKWLAHGSYDILQNAQVVDTFEESLAEIDFVIGTSAKTRSVKADYYPIDELPDIIKSKGNTISNIAIVFGREDTGLRNEELQLCDMVTSVPLFATYPSLNLSQAIMLYAYTLASFNKENEPSEQKFADDHSFALLRKRVEKILLATGMKTESSVYLRIMERLVLLKEKDVHLVHSICNKISNFMSEKKNSSMQQE